MKGMRGLQCGLSLQVERNTVAGMSGGTMADTASHRWCRGGDGEHLEGDFSIA